MLELIERYPREHYSLMQTGVKDGKRIWRHGDIGNFSGRQVIDAISKGGLWLNLRMVSEIDTRYHDMLGQMFAEVGEKVPGFALPHQYNAGILISAPEARVHLPLRSSGSEPDPDRRPQARPHLSVALRPS